MKFRRFVLVCMYYVYFDVFLSTKITGNSHTGTCTNLHLRIDHVDHQHYPMVVTQGVLANHTKSKDTFSLSQGETLIKEFMKFEQLEGKCEIHIGLYNFSDMHYTYINIHTYTWYIYTFHLRISAYIIIINFNKFNITIPCR